MSDRILILYGTVTGNAETCAHRTADRLRAGGFACEVKDIGYVPPAELTAERTLLLCLSTFGDGEPPDSAAPMWEAVVRAGAVRLPHLCFSVLALGDRSFTRFCQCGIDFDGALERLGGRRLAPQVDCDLDYESGWDTWPRSFAPSNHQPVRPDEAARTFSLPCSTYEHTLGPAAPRISTS